MATTTTQRRRHRSNGSGAPASAEGVGRKVTVCGPRPSDPRLALSLKAFAQILPKKRPYSELQSGDARWGASAHTSPAPSATLAWPRLPCAPPPLVPAAAAATGLAAPDTAAPPALHVAELYDPASPWGVHNMHYNPALPRWPGAFVFCPPPAVLQLPGKGRPYGVPHTPRAAPRPPKTPGAQAQRQAGQNGPDLDGVGGLLGAIRSVLDSPSQDRSSLADKHPVFVNGRAHGPMPPGHYNGASQQPPPAATVPPPSPLPAGTQPRPKKAKKGQPVRLKPAALLPAPPPSRPTPRCCPADVPSILHIILDGTSDKLAPRMVEQYAEHASRLCPGHAAKYQHLIASMPTAQRLVTPSSCAHVPTPEQDAATPAVSSALPHRKMDSAMAPLPLAPSTTHCHGGQGRLSPQPPPQSHPQPGPQQMRPPQLPPRKKKKISLDGQAKQPLHGASAVGGQDVRPVADPDRDSLYRLQMLDEIQERFKTTAGFEKTHGGVTNRVVYNLLAVATHPNVSPGAGRVDAHFLTGDEAQAMLDAGSPNEPVVTEREQTFRWQPRLRPIAELFQRMENLDRRVSVQVPSRSCMDDSFESRELTQVRDRFLANQATGDPWNILDLRSPLPAAVLPQFLTSENCQLLPRLRDEVLNPSRAERDTASREQWNEWRDVLEWVLLSQGGHNTSPHTDSHGLATWITVQEGLFGFGWMSHPTAEEREAWTADPQGFTGGRWCFLVLEPGQTVFFNSGTVHFVFRLRAEHTLALGGHVLQWSGIERWLQIVEAQMKNPHITNEDMEWSAPKYVRVVAKLVEMRLQNGRVDEMGGADAVRRLLRLLKDFDETYIKPRAKMKSKSKKKKRH